MNAAAPAFFQRVDGMPTEVIPLTHPDADGRVVIEDRHTGARRRVELSSLIVSH